MEKPHVFLEKMSMLQKSVTDLEAVAIGLVLQHQPCTAHFMRTCFKNSPTSHFSDSAGSVYPMMRRLADAGLVSARDKQEGQRKVRYFRCTKAGETALRDWVQTPAGDILGFDLLRTQIIYLGRLKKAEQRRWFEQARHSLQEKLSEIESIKDEVAADPSKTLFDQLAHDNAAMQIKARLKWLANCEKKVLGER